MFRTADAAGVSKIYLTGYTPCPLDRFGRIRKNLAKSALGAEKFVFWEILVAAEISGRDQKWPPSRMNTAKK